MRRITLLCGQLVSLVPEITGCVKETASNEAWNLFSEGPIKKKTRLVPQQDTYKHMQVTYAHKTACHGENQG